MAAPILVIQMQRMGDLILTYPLLLWLERQYPGHPVWVLAESSFAAALQRVSPRARYIGADQTQAVLSEHFHLVINLSHRPESQELAGRVHCEQLFGGYARQGVTRIHGQWQEYRASLVHNNRHNSFHWADMNALDVIRPALIAQTTWPLPRMMQPDTRKVGLFVGASEPDKRPQPVFWAELIRVLERQGLVPLLLGGPAEVPLCREIRALAKRSVASACGTLTLDQLAFLGQDLALLVTPDTGPMHLAAWTGLRVLNLSMGPVHAFETGPYQPGHVVLRSTRSCVGCWRCMHERPFCQDAFAPERVGRVVREMLRPGQERLHGLRLPGVEILFSDRDTHGLYDLRGFSSRQRASQVVSSFWRAFWLFAFGLAPRAGCLTALQDMARQYEALVRHMSTEALALLRSVAAARKEDRALMLDWGRYAAVLRPLSGYVATHLANHDCAPQSQQRAEQLIEETLALLSEA
ncbi:glycosyltransferase family 9 protein [Desulfovibrionales bacterium]